MELEKLTEVEHPPIGVPSSNERAKSTYQLSEPLIS